MNYPSIRIEGAILSPDILDKLEEAVGQKPSDFGFESGAKVKDEIARVWADAQDYWRIFQRRLEAVKEGSPDRTPSAATSETRNLWMAPLLGLLGYQLEYQQRGVELNGKTYAISHRVANRGQTPLHIIGWREAAGLDRKPDNATLRMSAHGLVQEYLNLHDELYGLVTNGRVLRLLRDSSRLVKLSYLEFDLERIFTDGLFADFAIFYRLLHATRLPAAPEQAAESLIEKYHQDGLEQGGRIRDGLRLAVMDALQTLGSGFLAHPDNEALREMFRTGGDGQDEQEVERPHLTGQTYFGYLLRLIYRLLFLMVIEERGLVFTPQTDLKTINRYYDHYSVQRLRRLAARRGLKETRFHDGWLALTATFHLFEQESAAVMMGTTPLGGQLFRPDSLGPLAQCTLNNADLFTVLERLSYFVHPQSGQRMPVNYGALATEEFGAVYESLLELHPAVSLTPPTFYFQQTAGNERKTSGSYYTPASLVDTLLDSALDPVIEDRLAQAKEEYNQKAQKFNFSKEVDLFDYQAEALLSVKVVDPACGSGHFLIAAAQRMGRRLALLRNKGDEPSPTLLRDCLRQVISHCIYGVDINPMAVELCQVGLWLEAVTPGKPLTFLRHHIQCGNSLIGATPALLAQGIPDEAFTPITGDDKAYCAEWKRQNKAQKNQLTLLSGDLRPWERLGNLAAGIRQLEGMADDTLAGVQAREAEYVRLTQSSDYEFGKLWADSWCAAFVWRKQPEARGGWPYPITEQVFRNLERSPHREPHWLKEEVERLAGQYQFFHWHLAFPEVFRPKEDLTGLTDVTGWDGGFDVVLGNPPWERIKIQEKEWFAAQDEAIATAPNAAARQKLIAQLPKTNPALYHAFEADKRKAEGESLFVRNSGKYPLCGRGDVNTYAIFAEMNRSIVSELGQAGFIVQSDIATADTYKFFFADLLDNKQLISLYDFVNTEGLFPHVHRTHPHFCLITISGKATTELADFAFWNTNTRHLQDQDRHFTLSAADLALLNPNTRTCPIFRSKRDAELTKAIYRRVLVLIKEGVGSGEVNPWGINFLRMFDMSNDSGLFLTREQLENEGWQLNGNRFLRNGEVYLPLYEAKMLHHFDHRWATYEGLDTRDVALAEKTQPDFAVLPRYWVREEDVNGRLPNKQTWLIGFRDITNTTNERTTIFSLLPKVAVGHTMPLVFLQALGANFGGYLTAGVDSLVFDYATRQKIGGTHMTYSYLKQLPVLPPQTYHQPCPYASRITHHAFLLPRVLELTYTAYDLRPFAQDCGYFGPPFRWDEDRRFLLRCELDAAYFHLYGIDRDDVDYIMETFPIVKRKDIAAHGEYRTKRVILEIYDDMAQASGQSSAYQTRLNPAPADPDAAHEWDEAYLGPVLPREVWWRETEEKQATSAEKVPVSTPPTLELRPQPAPKPKPKSSTTQKKLDFAPSLIVEFTPPQGGFAQRLKRVNAIGQPQNQLELTELIAALGDENGQIRWLAGASLVKVGGLAVVNLLGAYLRTNPGEVARGEALRVLGMIGEMSEDEGVKSTIQLILRS